MRFFSRRIVDASDKPAYEWDTEIRGLGVRTNRDRTVVYIAKLSVNGRPHWFTIGPLDSVKLTDARRIVQRMKLLSKSGEDPQSVLISFKYSEGLSTDSSITFKDFADLYIDRYAKTYKRSWLKDRQRIDGYLLPEWGDRKRLSDITRIDVLNIFKKLGKDRPIAANRLKELLSVMHTQAIVMGYLPENHTSITFGVRSYPEHPRREKIELEQMPLLISAIKAYPKSVYAQAIMFILHTGLRHQEAARFQWDWIDFERGRFTIPKESRKNYRDHTLPLTDPIRRILTEVQTDPAYKYVGVSSEFQRCECCGAKAETTQTLLRTFKGKQDLVHYGQECAAVAVNHNRYVFPSDLPARRKNAPISRLDKAWSVIRDAANLPTLRIHDLRRSVGCFILEQSGSLSQVRDVLGHTNEHVSAVYGFYTANSLKPVMDKHGEMMDSQDGSRSS